MTPRRRLIHPAPRTMLRSVLVAERQGKMTPVDSQRHDNPLMRVVTDVRSGRCGKRMLLVIKNMNRDFLNLGRVQGGIKELCNSMREGGEFLIISSVMIK